MATAETQTMVVGIDDSEHSTYALQWTLDHFFANSTVNPPFKLVIVHARPSPSAVIGLAGHGKVILNLSNYSFGICPCFASFKN